MLEELFEQLEQKVIELGGIGINNVEYLRERILNVSDIVHIC